MSRLIILTFLLVVFICHLLPATEYWSRDKINGFEAFKSTFNVQTLTSHSDNFIRNLPPSIEKANYPYPAEFLQISYFLAQWQVLDPASPDYGGMIEAESGALGDVIQTDNTQEAIVVWCQYAWYTGDTITYRNNIDAAWTYIMNFPAYDEEGDIGDDYYRDHNCAWALWGVYWYETIYQDLSYRWYSDSCANYMMTHQIDVFDPESNLNAFVMGWMAANLYFYGQWLSTQEWIDSSLVIGEKVLDWANADPQNHLADFTWAMSSGTAVHGICNSVFKEDSLAGVAWLQNNAQYIPLYFDNSSAGDYVWDSGWNVALANAYRAMHDLTQNGTYDSFHKVLTDTLLALDTDDDGGITANKNHPITEDMTWVSAYLNVMGIDYRMQGAVAYDAGVVQIFQPDTNWTYIIGDTISVEAKVANFGWQDLQNVQISFYANGVLVADTAIDLAFAEMINLEYPDIYVIQNSGSLEIKVETALSGDMNPANDQLNRILTIPPFITLTGTLRDADNLNGVRSNIFFYHYQRTFSGESDPVSGQFQIDVIPGEYSVYVDAEFPHQQLRFDSLVVGQTPPPPYDWITLRADVVFVDDDELAQYEDYFIHSFYQIIINNPALPWRAYHHWDAAKKGIFEASRFNDLTRPWVVWFTGDADSTALTSQERDSLQYLLNHNACVLLTGKDIAESLQGTQFLYQNLSVTYTGNSSAVPKIAYGVSGDPISNGTKYFTQGEPGANNQGNDRDIIESVSPAHTIFHYRPQSIEPAGIRLDNGYKLVFLGFGVEGVRDGVANFNNRDELLERVFYWFEGISGIDENEEIISHRFELQPLYPNPFNNEIYITFSVDKNQEINLAVYNILGQRIRNLLHSNLNAGEHGVHWNGKSDVGKPAASGLYYIVLKGKENQSVRKALLLK